MRHTIRIALVLAVLATGVMLLLGAYSAQSPKETAKSPFLSSLSDAAVGSAIACPTGCTNKYTGPRHLQCLNTTNCTDCVWSDIIEGWQTVPCN